MANVDNEKLSDAEFRQFVRNTLPIVEKPDLESFANEEMRNEMNKYYDYPHKFGE